MSWPYRLGDKANMFAFGKLDPNEVPELKVTTWSDVFNDGGSVSVDVYLEGKRFHTPLARIGIETNRTVTDEREHLQNLVNDWNEDATGNWYRLVNSCRDKLKDYYEKQIAESKEKLADLEGASDDC